MIRRIISLIMALILIFSLASCGEIHYSNGDNADNNQSTPAENENENSAEDNEDNKVVYIYSVTSKVIHLDGCYHIDRMNEDYKKTFEGDVAELLEKEYTLCKYCFPPEKEEEDVEQEPEDDENKIAKEDATFVINSKSLKFHQLDCQHVSGMNESNTKYPRKR